MSKYNHTDLVLGGRKLVLAKGHGVTARRTWVMESGGTGDDPATIPAANIDEAARALRDLGIDVRLGDGDPFDATQPDATANKFNELACKIYHG